MEHTSTTEGWGVRLTAAAILLASYAVFFPFLSLLGVDRLVLFPASAVALCVLFFGGIRLLLPIVFCTALLGYVLAGYPLVASVLLSFAQVLVSGMGAYLLRSARVDPLFRRSRDAFFVLGITLLVSVFLPTAGILAQYSDPMFSEATWLQSYAGSVFSLFILVPFLLRWYAKPRFNRGAAEAAITASVFAALIAINHLLFVSDLRSIAGIPFVYVLLVPLFYIALRLRPRFITLALLITSGYALAGLLLSTMSFEALFQIQVFLIVLSAIFLILASLEENRRLSTNLANSQVAALQNAVSRVSSESKAKNDFIAILAHELRNPLAPIASGIDLLKLKGTHDAEDTDTLSMMEDRMHVIRRLLDDLLDISRVHEGKLEIRQEPVDLETALTRAITSTAHHFKDRHQSLDADFPKESLIVRGDMVRLEQVFSNLLTNASKYSDSGDAVFLTLAKNDAMAEITIVDEGLGIDPTQLTTIFTPFHQADNGERTAKGLGIGLALVKSFVEVHGGTVDVASAGRGHGSRFTVLLPLSGTSGTPVAKKKTKTLNPLSKESGLTVLVVDDNDAAAWGIGRLLELRGCVVSYAYDGDQAIDRAERDAPDVILLDLGLPDTDGYAVAKTMRARGFHGRIIALTGFSTPDARANVRAAGIEQYLVKPAGLSDLMRAIPELG